MTQESTKHSASDRSSNSPSTTNETTSHSIYQALKGYSLFKHHEKLAVIVDFLRMSSHNPISISNDPSIIARIDNLCETPKVLLRRMSKSCKYPSTWTTHFCATFICDVVETIDEDRKLNESKVVRKSNRKSHCSYSSLPPAAFALYDMHRQARLKVENETISRKRKTDSRVKSVHDLLIKSTVHNPEFVEVRPEQIIEDLLCPMCNHRSLIAVSTKEEVDMANDVIKESYEKKFKEWEANGKKGSKPRMGKTESQILGCVCYVQNCIGNSDGSGCFRCKSSSEKLQKKLDNR